MLFVLLGHWPTCFDITWISMQSWENVRPLKWFLGIGQLISKGLFGRIQDTNKSFWPLHSFRIRFTVKFYTQGTKPPEEILKKNQYISAGENIGQLTTIPRYFLNYLMKIMSAWSKPTTLSAFLYHLVRLYSSILHSREITVKVS